MLHFEAIEPKTLELLKKLQELQHLLKTLIHSGLTGLK